MESKKAILKTLTLITVLGVMVAEITCSASRYGCVGFVSTAIETWAHGETPCPDCGFPAQGFQYTVYSSRGQTTQTRYYCSQHAPERLDGGLMTEILDWTPLRLFGAVVTAGLSIGMLVYVLVLLGTKHSSLGEHPVSIGLVWASLGLYLLGWLFFCTGRISFAIKDFNLFLNP